MYRTVSLGIFLVLMAFASCKHSVDGSNVKEKLAAAKEAGNTVLMVVSQKELSADSMMAVVQEANKVIKNNVVITMDCSDASNADLVEAYQLTAARMPLVLAFSNKGILLGGVTKAQLNMEALIEIIPTPRFNDIIYAISQGKSTFTIVSKKTFADRDACLNACVKAQQQLPSLVDIVAVDIDDPEEAKLLKLLNVDAKILETNIYVINSLGETTAKFDGAPEPSELVEAAQAKIQRSCSHNHSGDEHSSNCEAVE